MNEYAIVRMDRMEAGTKELPADHPRRCRYYINAPSLDAATQEADRRWKGERIVVTLNKVRGN